MNNNWKTFADIFITKAIIFNLYLFAFGSFVSKSLTSISGGLICIFGLLQIIIFKKNPFKSIDAKIIDYPILFFTFALFMAILDNPDAEAFSKLFKYVGLFLFFYTTGANLNDPKQIKILIINASISMIIANIYGLYQHFILNYPRVGSFATPLGFGCLLAIFMIFTIVYGFWGNFQIRYRIYLLLSTILLLVNLLLTQARGAWLAVMGGLVVLSLIKTKKILILFIVVFFIFNLFLPQLYIDKFLSSFDLTHNLSNLGRIALWKGALLMYKDHFINGVGLGRFSIEYETKYLQPFTNTTCHAHNNILQFMAETGTLGLIAFIWLMSAIMIWLYKTYSRTTNLNHRLFTLASFCGLIVFHIQGLTEFNYGDTETLRFFWFLVSINMALVKIFKEKNNQNTANNNEYQINGT